MIVGYVTSYQSYYKKWWHLLFHKKSFRVINRPIADKEMYSSPSEYDTGRNT